MVRGKEFFAWLVVAAVLAFGMAQTVRPALIEPSGAGPSGGSPSGPQTEIAAPPQVRAVLERRCYACHSNSPRLAWFDEIEPAYWFVAQDVREARAHLNFSELGNKPAAAQRAELFEAVNMVQLGAMPLPSYLAVHRDARVTPEELAILKNYLAPFAPATAPTPTPAATPTTPQLSPQHAAVTPAGPSPNGVPYLSGWQDWQLVSTTDRGDNHTLRIITGNDVAIKAIAGHHTSPWPDGAAFAKIAVAAIDDGKGSITSGPFIQVEFMEKDATKYAATEGWGFARWRGADLKPYGSGPHFDSECTGCHAPMRHNDYVYTMPIARDGGAQ